MYQSAKPIIIEGGLDLVSTPYAIPPGRLIACQNYEPTQRGYQRMDGYERFDGHPKPSMQTYQYLNFTNGTAAILAGQTVTGATSGATGTMLVAATVSSGAYVSNNAAGHFGLGAVTGTFQAGENLQVAAVTVAVLNGATVQNGALTDSEDTSYFQTAVTNARSLIAAVPGSGNVLGVWCLNGTKFAFRNNVAGTAAQMWQATTTGWSMIALGLALNFNAATSGYTPQAGDTITGATSAATAVLQKICVTNGLGTWAAGSTGFFVFAAQVGTFQNGEQINIGAHNNVCTTTSIANPQTLGASGTFDFINHNLIGNASGVAKKMYGCNGAGRGFEYDGTVFVSIQTGMATDKPKHVSVYKDQLFFAFSGGSVQNSGIGLPYTWSVIVGANELVFGEEITGLSKTWVDTLVVYGKTRIKQLNGNNVNDFSFTDVNLESGGLEWTDDQVGGPVYIDQRGLRSIATTQAFGNFQIGTLTKLVQPWFNGKQPTPTNPAGYIPVAACVVKSKDQYRAFYNDGSALVAYFSKQNEGGISAMTPVGMPIATGLPTIALWQLPINVTCACSVDDATYGGAVDVTLVGTDTGMVYEFDRGTSFDGAACEAFITFPFFNAGTPTMNKSWKKATVGIDCQPTSNLVFTAEFSDADPDTQPTAEIQPTVYGGGGYWDRALWNQFLWSQPYTGKALATTEGVGTNISLSIYSNTIWDKVHTVHSLAYDFSPRGPVRQGI